MIYLVIGLMAYTLVYFAISTTKEYQSGVREGYKIFYGSLSVLCSVMLAFISALYLGRYERGETKSKPKYEQVTETFYRKIK
jgi:hypothetical protein